MCGRYVIKNPVTKTGSLVKSAIQVEDSENYNAHPYQKLPVIKKYKNGNLKPMSNLVDLAVFPGNQGGPLEHVIGAKGIAFSEALEDTFLNYMLQQRIPRPLHMPHQNLLF